MNTAWIDQPVAAFDFCDCVSQTLPPTHGTASNVLARILEGAMQRAPAHVQRWMRWRNALVRPLRLRTSPLGCPVSGLLATNAPLDFANRFPVQRITGDGVDVSQVWLAVEDRHLRFRTRIWVQRTGGVFQASMATDVQTLNAFGWLYMRLIHRTHRHYVAPAILQHAIAYAVDVEADNSRALPGGHDAGCILG